MSNNKKFKKGRNYNKNRNQKQKNKMQKIFKRYIKNQTNKMKRLH